MENRIISGNQSVAGAGSTVRNKNNSEGKNSTGSTDSAVETANLSSDSKQTIQELEKIIRAVQGPEKAFEISVHKETHAIMVKVFDKQTGDLIREIPSQKLLDVAANMMELNGLIFDEKA